MGWLAGGLITRLATFGYRISMRVLNLWLWLEKKPGSAWRLHVRLHVENFGMMNPPGCRRTCNL